MLVNDTLCLTETQLQFADNLETMKDQRQRFISYFNVNENKYKSLAFCHSNSVTFVRHETFDGISLLTIKKLNVLEYPLTVALLYRSQAMPVSTFIDSVYAVLSQSQFHILLGDFNINAFDESPYRRLQYILNNYIMIVSEPTHLDGFLLDHVYVNNTILSDLEATAYVKNVYFTDHDAVRICLKQSDSRRY